MFYVSTDERYIHLTLTSVDMSINVIFQTTSCIYLSTNHLHLEMLHTFHVTMTYLY